MHRRPLLELLERYLNAHPEDLVHVDHVRQFVRQHPDCFERSCLEGHITGAAWVVTPQRDRVCLVHHRKLDRWLQPGGHADGETDVAQVALAEAREETGLSGLRLVSDLPLDVDVHRIPARGDVPAHLHHDIRFLVEAPGDQAPVVSDESHAVAWFPVEDIPHRFPEPSLLRMWSRARPLG